MQRTFLQVRKVSAHAALAAAAWLLAALFAGHALFSALSAFSNLNYLFSDYGVYSNTIWNVGHGNGFRFLVDHRYLETHLSFSLALLSPLYYLFDTPRLLIFVQWLFLLAGGGVLLRTFRRLHIPPVLTASIVAWYVAHPYTQSVLLSEFHGVSAYYLLIPWLTHTLLFSRRWAWLPLAVALGLREDAGLYLPIILVYVAWFTRKRTGYILAGVSLAYALVAVLVLYPAINGISLFETRSAEVSPAWSTEDIRMRLQATFWLVLPMAPFLWLNARAWRPMLAFAGLPWLISMLSGHTRQFELGFHYPAVAMAALAASLPVALAAASDQRVQRGVKRAAGMLLALTLAAHAARGFFLLGARCDPVYTRPGDQGSMLCDLTADLPSEGLLLANRRLALFGALREEVSTWRYWKTESQDPDFVLCLFSEFYQPHTEFLREGLTRGTWGVRSGLFPYFVLERGVGRAPRHELLEWLAYRRLPAYSMPGHHQENRLLPGHGLARFWPGDRARYPVTVAHGRPRLLLPGDWDVVFTYRAFPPIWPDKSETGWFSLHRPGEALSLARGAVAIPPTAAVEDLQRQVLSIELDEPGEIEARMTGECAELWLLHIDFVPR